MKAAAAALCGDIFTDLEATGKIIVEFVLTKLTEILISPKQDKSKWRCNTSIQQIWGEKHKWINRGEHGEGNMWFGFRLNVAAVSFFFQIIETKQVQERACM